MNDGNASNGAPGIGQRVDQVGRDAQTLISDARVAVQDIRDRLDLRGRVEKNPYGMLLAAAGIGYVLGGGLFTPLTAKVVRFGFKLAAIPFVKDELLGMAHGAVDGFVQSARERQESMASAPVAPDATGRSGV